MSEKQTDMIERIEIAFLDATEVQQEYMLGICEGVALANRTRKPAEDEKKQNV